MPRVTNFIKDSTFYYNYTRTTQAQLNNHEGLLKYIQVIFISAFIITPLCVVNNIVLF